METLTFLINLVSVQNNDKQKRDKTMISIFPAKGQGRFSKVRNGQNTVLYENFDWIGLQREKDFQPSLAQSKGGEVCPCGPSQVTSVQSIMGVLTLK